VKKKRGGRKKKGEKQGTRLKEKDEIPRKNRGFRMGNLKRSGREEKEEKEEWFVWPQGKEIQMIIGKKKKGGGHNHLLYLSFLTRGGEKKKKRERLARFARS